jgi:hypothetical protein
VTEVYRVRKLRCLELVPVFFRTPRDWFMGVSDRQCAENWSAAGFTLCAWCIFIWSRSAKGQRNAWRAIQWCLPAVLFPRCSLFSQPAKAAYVSLVWARSTPEFLPGVEDFENCHFLDLLSRKSSSMTWLTTAVRIESGCPYIPL